jgi:hypothetical protein
MTDPEQSADFSTFVLGLASSAMFYLGAMPDPETNQSDINLPLARQTIDILSMLHQKTAGNLTEDEVNLFDKLLYDLRLRYVEHNQDKSD